MNSNLLSDFDQLPLIVFKEVSGATAKADFSVRNDCANKFDEILVAVIVEVCPGHRMGVVAGICGCHRRSDVAKRAVSLIEIDARRKRMIADP